MRLGLSWLWRMLIYLVGAYAYVQPGPSVINNNNSEVFYCNECDKMFLSRGGRDKHIKRKHLSDNKIQC